MAYVVSGMTLWPKASPAVCIVSNGSCVSRVFGHDRAAAAYPRITANRRSSPTMFSIASLSLTDRTRNGWPTSPIWTAERWLYVAAVIDLFSRRLKHLTGGPRKSINNALRRLIESARYTSEQFQRLMKDNGVTCSMSQSGNCWDNAAMERFISSLKTERIRRKVYRSRDQARGGVFDYIERFYNPTPRHSTMGYLSPIDLETPADVA